jgi:ceramide glucosyltransferase
MVSIVGVLLIWLTTSDQILVVVVMSFLVPMQPLAGADPNLKDNLETFFNLKYPKYEIIFCIQSKNDPSEEVVRELIAAYPHIETHIFTGAEDSVVNPKINNILQGYPSVKYGFLWIVDSSLLTVPTTLLEMVTQMQTVPNCGLVHQMPYWASKPDFASCLNQVYFGTQHARMFLSSIVLRQLCASGASMLLQKAHLEEVGGLRHFGQYLAEDYFLAKALTDKGYKVVLSSLPAIQNPGVTSLSIFCRRLARWTRLRSRMVPIVILEPISECMVVGVLFCLAIYYIMGIWPVWSFMFHLAIWMSFDYILFRRVENGPLLNLKMLFVAWWVRELLSLPIFISGVLSGKVQWKDKEFCLKWGGQVDVKIKGSRPSFNV